MQPLSWPLLSHGCASSLCPTGLAVHLGPTHLLLALPLALGLGQEQEQEQGPEIPVVHPQWAGPVPAAWQLPLAVVCWALGVWLGPSWGLAVASGASGGSLPVVLTAGD